MFHLSLCLFVCLFVCGLFSPIYYVYLVGSFAKPMKAKICFSNAPFLREVCIVVKSLESLDEFMKQIIACCVIYDVDYIRQKMLILILTWNSRDKMCVLEADCITTSRKKTLKYLQSIEHVGCKQHLRPLQAGVVVVAAFELSCEF